MLTAEAVAFGGVAIPPVNKEDLKRLWLRLQHKAEGAQATSAISYDKRILSESVQSDSDPLAVFARTIILTYLKTANLLDLWKVGGEVQDIVYQKAAEFPLPLGMQSFQPDLLIKSLEEFR